MGSGECLGCNMGVITMGRGLLYVVVSMMFGIIGSAELVWTTGGERAIVDDNGSLVGGVVSPNIDSSTNLAGGPDNDDCVALDKELFISTVVTVDMNNSSDGCLIVRCI